MADFPASSSVPPPTPPSRYEGVFEPVKGKPEQLHFLYKVAPTLILDINAKPLKEVSSEESENWLKFNIRNLSEPREPTEETILIDVESLAAQLKLDPKLLKQELADAKKVGDVAVQSLLKQKVKNYSEFIAQKLDVYVQANKNFWKFELKGSNQEFLRKKIDLGLPQSFHAVITKAGQIFIKAKSSPVFARGASSAIKELELHPKQSEVLAVRRVQQGDRKALQQQTEILNRVKGLEGVYDFHFAYTYKGKNSFKFGILSKFEKFGSLDEQMTNFSNNQKDLSDGLSSLGKTTLPDATDDAIRQILIGIMNVHQKGVLHRDIKADNILVGEENGVLKLKVADFDLACLLNQKEEMQLPKGTPAFFSPEICKGLRGDDVSSISFGTPIDMWGFGILCYQMLYDQYPMYVDFLGEMETAKRADSGADITPFLDKAIAAMEDLSVYPHPGPNAFPIEILVWRALRPNPAERITFKEFLDELDKSL